MKSTTLAAALVLAVGSHHAPAQEVDKDGCWEAYDCVTAATEWNGDNFIVRHTNVCGKEVIVWHCSQAVDVSSGMHCGRQGLIAGQSLRWETKSWLEPTGRYAWAWVGSTILGNGMACLRKVGLDDWKPNW